MTRRLGWALLVGAGLAWACSDGAALRRARFACTTSGECADGYQCLSGECQRPGASDAGGGSGGGEAAAGGGAGGASTGGGQGGGGTGGGAAGGRDAGVECAATPQCGTGLTCVDGVCCRSACGAPCDSCNQPGNLGTCLPRPAGEVSAACAGYACNGSSAACPTTCTQDGDIPPCASGYTCVVPACQACWTRFSEDFDAGLAQWTVDGATVDALGRLEISVRARANMPVAATATVSTAYPLEGCGVSVQLTRPPTLGNNYSGAMRLGANTTQGLPSFAFVFDDRGLVAEWRLADGGVGAEVLQDPTSTVPRWLRIDEQRGVIRWRATSRTTFATLHAVEHGGALGPMKLSFSGSFPQQGGNDVSTYTVDNINLGP